jgi:acetyl esterase/lipase
MATVKEYLANRLLLPVWLAISRPCIAVAPALLALVLLLPAGCGGGGGGGASSLLPEPITVIVPSLTEQYTFTVESDIVYGQAEVNGGGSFRDLTLDLYIPDEFTDAQRKQFPLMLMMHGGFFAVGNKTNREIIPSAEAYARRGWIVASINYRLQADDPVPSSQVQPLIDSLTPPGPTLLERTVIAGIDDVINALEFLHARDDVYAPWTTLWGFSAGAYLALLTGYALDDFGIEPVEVAAIIDYAGSIDGRFTGGTPFDFPLGRDPVLQIIHGTADAIVPFSEAETLEGLAVAAGLPFDFQAVAGAPHEIDLFATNASTGVSLFQRTVDYQFETVFAGQASGPLVIE